MMPNNAAAAVQWQFFMDHIVRGKVAVVEWKDFDVEASHCIEQEYQKRCLLRRRRANDGSKKNRRKGRQANEEGSEATAVLAIPESPLTTTAAEAAAETAEAVAAVRTAAAEIAAAEATAEAAATKGQDGMSFQIRSGYFKYIINFQTMTQLNVSSGRTRAIRPIHR